MPIRIKIQESKNQEQKDADPINSYPIKDWPIFFEDILNLNFNIKDKIFKQTIFEDKELEQKFQKENMFYKHKKFMSDFILVLGNIISVFYILFFINKLILMIAFMLNLCISLILIALSIKFEKYTKLIDHINVFVLNICLIFKLLAIIFIFKDELEQITIHKEIIRIIIYHFVLINLIILFKFEASFFIFTIYFLMNVAIIIIAIIKLRTNNALSYEFEAFVSFGFTYIMFAVRKIYENLSRKIYSEKIKYKRLYDYALNFIEELNLNQICLKGEKIIFMNQKLFNHFEYENNNDNSNNDYNNYSNINNNNDINISSLNLKPKKNLLEILKNYEILKNEEFYNLGNESLNNSYDKHSSRIKTINKKNLLEIIREIQRENFLEENEFHRIGIFESKNSPNKFFNVILRSTDSNIKFQDIIFFDVSEFLSMRKKIYEQNLIKEKVIAKLAHELKTPINSIIGLINKLVEKNSMLSVNNNNNNLYRNNSNELINFKNINNIKNNYNNNFNTIITKNNFNNNTNDTNLSNDLKEKLHDMRCISTLSNYTIYLVNDIIQYFSNKEKSNLYQEPIYVIEVINFTHDILKTLLYMKNSIFKNVKAILEIDEIIRNVKINCDDIRLKQILLNLISNAVKFCSQGSITIKCKYFEEKNNVAISVIDTGIGIKESDKENIFDDFVMLEDKEKLNRQGTGLGLSICKNLSKQLELNFYCNSEYGKGTEFVLEIPILEIEKENSIKNNFSAEYECQIPRECKENIFLFFYLSLNT